MTTTFNAAKLHKICSIYNDQTNCNKIMIEGIVAAKAYQHNFNVLLSLLQNKLPINTCTIAFSLPYFSLQIWLICLGFLLFYFRMNKKGSV